MGCPNCAPIKVQRPADLDLVYHERIVSDGLPRTIDFKSKNRRVVKVWTYDRQMDFTWTPDAVSISGPIGTEVMVNFTIGR